MVEDDAVIEGLDGQGVRLLDEFFVDVEKGEEFSKAIWMRPICFMGL